MITSREPDDLPMFCEAIIRWIVEAVGAPSTVSTN